MFAQLQHLISSCSIPLTRRSVLACGRNVNTIRAVTDTRNRIHMPAQIQHQVSVTRIPDLRDTVGTASDDTFAIRTESDAITDPVVESLRLLGSDKIAS